jgi:hypothetical protein
MPNQPESPTVHAIRAMLYEMSLWDQARVALYARLVWARRRILGRKTNPQNSK